MYNPLRIVVKYFRKDKSGEGTPISDEELTKDERFRRLDEYLDNQIHSLELEQRYIEGMYKFYGVPPGRYIGEYHSLSF